MKTDIIERAKAERAKQLAEEERRQQEYAARAREGTIKNAITSFKTVFGIDITEDDWAWRPLNEIMGKTEPENDYDAVDETPAPFMEVDGLHFYYHGSGGYGGAWMLVRACSTCGRKIGEAVHNLTMLGELIESGSPSTEWYHEELHRADRGATNERPAEEQLDLTPTEKTLIKALRDLTGGSYYGEP